MTVGAALLSDDWSARFSAAETMANKVLSLAPNHALAHVSLSVVQMCTKRVVQGIAECERALALDHNLALVHSLIGTPNISLVEAQKPKVTSTRRFAFLLATPLLLN
jgi:hypothetical protein